MKILERLTKRKRKEIIAVVNVAVHVLVMVHAEEIQENVLLRKLTKQNVDTAVIVI